MKKIVSLMALCAVLLGAVMMVTGCGAKPDKGTVWKITKVTVDGKSEEAKIPEYYCFHSDGNFYYALKKDDKLVAIKKGAYTIEEKTKKITMFGTSFDYSTSGNKMTLKATIAEKQSVLELQKSSDYTEKQIKDAVVAVPTPSK